MQNITEIKLISMTFLPLLLILPLIIFIISKVNILKELIISILRMIIQLITIGFILQYIFNWNSFIITSLWCLFIIFVADYNVFKKIKIKGFILINYSVIFLTISSTIIFILFFIIKPFPLWDAKYLIPLTGILAGNCMNANSLVIEKFYNFILNNKQEYYSYIAIGATISEATHNFFIESYKRGLLPTVTSITTAGIIFLPDIMTGQLLSGIHPLSAIKYQILIMIAIFTVNSISSFFMLILLRKKIINKNGIIMI